MDLRRLLNTTYAYLVEGADEEQRAKLDRILEEEPPAEARKRGVVPSLPDDVRALMGVFAMQ